MSGIDPGCLDKNDLAPIALFTFNRPEHTNATLLALKNAIYASYSDLFIFIDGPRSEEDKVNIAKVRLLVEKLDGFKSINIYERKSNIGLAESISKGVSEIINKRNKVIVLEDDIVVSKGFLSFMNQALQVYESNSKVWHISGYNVPIDAEGEERVFFYRLMFCWGWATWKDRWSHFVRDSSFFIENFSKEEIYRFNIDGCENFWIQMKANHSGLSNTWAIFWYATIFKKNGLCLNPVISHVNNIGFDGSGIHCGGSPSNLFSNKYSIKKLNSACRFLVPVEQVEDKEILEKIKRHYLRFRIGLVRKIYQRLKSMMNKLVKV